MRIFIVTLLFFSSSFSSAANWQPVNGQSKEFPILTEVDTTSVKTRGLLVEATFRFTHFQPQISATTGENFLSAEVKNLFDCELKTFAPFHRTEFSESHGKGKVVGAYAVQNSQIQLRPIVHGSMNEVMLNHICSLGKHLEAQDSSAIRSNESSKNGTHSNDSSAIGSERISFEEMDVFPNLNCEQHATSRSEVRARHIAINVFPRNTYAWSNSNEKLEDFRAAYIKINNARNELKLGTPFEVVWEKYSNLETAPAGGDLGFFKRGVMVAEFEKVAFCLPIGIVSPVIKTFLGFHLIQVTDVRD